MGTNNTPERVIPMLERMKTDPVANADYLLMPGCKPMRWQFRMVAEAYKKLAALQAPVPSVGGWPHDRVFQRGAGLYEPRQYPGCQ